jgi:predicted phosphodiesterase
MIIGVLSDAHGHEEGFFKCYNYLKAHADVIYYLGDCVGYFPLSNLIIDTLIRDNVYCLKGNHEAMFLGEQTIADSKDEIFQLVSGRNLISDRNKSFLTNLKSQINVEIDGRKITFVHGSPFDVLNGYVFENSDFEPFKSLESNVFFMGHTHCAFNMSIDGQLFVNVGSCGFSRDIGNLLTVALYDTVKNEAVVKTIEINVLEVLKKYGEFLHQIVKDSLNQNHF